MARHHPELRLHAFGVVPGARVARIENTDAVAYELKEILVAGDDSDVEAGGLGLSCNSADHVVRFDPLVRQDRDAECFARLVDRGRLNPELVRHRRTIRLVLGVELGAKRGAAQIERGGDQRRPVVRNQLPEHRYEAVDGVRRAPVGGREPPDAVVGAVHLRAAVDEKKRVGH